MPAGERVRADLLLVERGLFESRARAQAAIEAGLVVADGAPVRKASEKLRADAILGADAPLPFVSRGGVKLAAALDAFAIDPADLHCLDVGASTGGFTDCLLQRGARHVTAVDVGRGQLHLSLAQDPRVTHYERQDIRSFEADWLAEAPTLATIDVSFISIRLVLPAVARLLAPGGALVALIKPQFEVGRGRVGKGGVVRDESSRIIAVAEVRTCLAELGFDAIDVIESPIAGGDGNVEYLAGARFGR